MTQEDFFDLSGDIYMQIEGVAMGSSLVPKLFNYLLTEKTIFLLKKNEKWKKT